MKRFALLFKNYYEESFSKEDQSVSEKLASEFFTDFIHYTPIKLELLGSYLKAGRIDYFYQSLSDLKYLVEFSDSLNRYWYLLRAYSSALSKLKADLSVKNAKKLYSHYFEIYGDRRTLRNEHWFEKKRWEFLDELQLINREDELSVFIGKYQQVLSENLKIYESFIMTFVNDLKKLHVFPKPVKRLKAG
jgi:hypothetical protein